MEINGSVNEKSSDGNINITIKDQLNNDYNLSTSDGDIELYMPKNIKTNISAKTGDGRIKSEIPVKITCDDDNNYIEATLNGGGPLIKMKTLDGDIFIREL